MHGTVNTCKFFQWYTTYLASLFKRRVQCKSSSYLHDEDIPDTVGPRPITGHWGPCPQLADADLTSQARLTTLPSLFVQHWACSRTNTLICSFVVRLLRPNMIVSIMEEIDIHREHWAEGLTGTAGVYAGLTSDARNGGLAATTGTFRHGFANWNWAWS